MRVTRWAFVSVCLAVLLAGHASASTRAIAVHTALRVPAKQLLDHRPLHPFHTRHDTARSACSSARCDAHDVLHRTGHHAPYVAAPVPCLLWPRAPPAIAGSVTKTCGTPRVWDTLGDSVSLSRRRSL
jgi:hypothetical protein